MRYLTPALAVAVAISFSACASGAGTETGGARPQEDLITAEELAEVNAYNAYEAVEQLRPQWLTQRGARTFTDPTPRVPMVFLDRMEYGELASMRTVVVSDVAEIRYYDGREAVARFGVEYEGGIIQIITR
ncbi:MAG: hypothetical protein PVJ64_17020 [Gemmatimonadales bacterium]|jgi:hypothetical protein